MENLESKKRSQFITLLFKLASSQSLLKTKVDKIGIYRELDSLYFVNKEKIFRHFYSDIYFVLVNLKDNPQKGSAEALIQNLQVLRGDCDIYRQEYITDQEKFKDCLKKLYDHSSLEFSHLDKTSENEKTVLNMLTSVDELNKEIVEQKNKIENIQKNYVGILSIFAAVIVAFTTGTAFSSSVLNNIDNVTIYRLVFICLLLGSVLLNILYVLFNFILIIVKGNKLDIKACLIPNIIIGVLLVITIVAWCYGAVEKRNESFIISDNNITEQVKTNTKEKTQ